MDLLVLYAEATAACFGPFELVGYGLAGLLVRPLRLAFLVGLAWGLVALALPYAIEPSPLAAEVILAKVIGALTGSLIAMLAILIIVDSALRIWHFFRH